jgi:hypothetical protein
LDGLNDLVDVSVDFNLPLLLSFVSGGIEGCLYLIPEGN